MTQHLFDVEETDFAVGTAQCGDAPKVESGGARAVEMGLEGMGPHSNCFMVLSVPNKDSLPDAARWLWRGWRGCNLPISGLRQRLWRRALRTPLGEQGKVGLAKSRADVSIERPEKETYKEPIVLTMLFTTPRPARAQGGSRAARGCRARHFSWNACIPCA